MRRFLPWILLAALAVGGFLVTQHYLRSPYWSLYQIGKAIHNHDSRLFLAYVDLGRVIASQKDAIVEMIFPAQDKHQQRDVVKQILSAFMAPITEQVRDRVVRAIEDQERDNLPSSWTLVALGSVAVEGEQAQVVLTDPVNDRRLRLGMQRSPEGHWRVVEANTQDLKALAEKYLLAQRVPAATRSPANGGPQAVPAN